MPCGHAPVCAWGTGWGTRTRAPTPTRPHQGRCEAGCERGREARMVLLPHDVGPGHLESGGGREAGETPVVCLPVAPVPRCVPSCPCAQIPVVQGPEIRKVSLGPDSAIAGAGARGGLGSLPCSPQLPPLAVCACVGVCVCSQTVPARAPIGGRQCACVAPGVWAGGGEWDSRGPSPRLSPFLPPRPPVGTPTPRVWMCQVLHRPATAGVWVWVRPPLRLPVRPPLVCRRV